MASIASPPTEYPVILVVEHDRAMCDFLRECLGEAHLVEAAIDGSAGLARALELDPDVIICGATMQDPGGEARMRALLAHPALVRKPVLFLTARTEGERRVRAGAQGYLRRPFSVEELRARVGALAAQGQADELARDLARQLEDVTRASKVAIDAIARLPEVRRAEVLRTIARWAQVLTGAELAAVGIGVDPARSFDRWVQVGMSPEELAHLGGRRPRPVGILGAGARGETGRTSDVRQDDRLQGRAPDQPPPATFLGVPIRCRGQPEGNLYLANKRGAAEFTPRDEAVVAMLAAQAGVAVEADRLHRAIAVQGALELAIEQLPVGVLLVDAEGRVEATNRALRALSRVDLGGADSLGNRFILDLRRPSSERIPAEESPHVRALAGEAVPAQDLLLAQQDGRLVPVRVTAAPVHDRWGAVVGGTMVVVDDTAREELARARAEWAAVVAHELRQPVAMIAYAAELLSRLERAGRGGDEASALTSSILGSIGTMKRIIEDLLDVSCLEARQLGLALRAVVLPDLVRDVVARRPDLAGRCEVRVAPGAEEPVPADPVRLEQVLGNLLSNALKYGEPAATIEVALERQEEAQQVTVTNRGPWIPADELPLLFSRFQRTRAATSSGVEGLGLGLNICKGLVEAHGGRIWAESAPGQATSFHFKLPIATGRAAIRAGP